ncbi:hypothetical protein [Citricoccus sp. NR2]|uniref:hypothetical protein n=1 Tax=Citricoccus sp. NR2 TaxID=3004095 RepID=UPI0022DD56A5|nr:hypothetical protein [Citricoccus sp. NR2]WBL18416.1 hypothetical protein O1A05_11645 [Citricoccus sp. NR2]
MSEAMTMSVTTKRLRGAVLMGATTAVATAIPLGRLPLGRTAAVSAVLGAAAMGAGLLVARARDASTPVATCDHEAPATGPHRSRTIQGVAILTVAAGAVASFGMTTSVLADRWIEKGVRALGSQHPRLWMIAGAGVLGTMLEWFDQPAPSSDSPEASPEA